MLDGNGSKVGTSPRITQLVEKSAGRCLEALHILGGHLRSPISQAGSDGTQARPILMKPQHGLVVRQAQKRADRSTHLCGMVHERLIAYFAVQFASESPSGIPP